MLTLLAVDLHLRLPRAGRPGWQPHATYPDIPVQGANVARASSPGNPDRNGLIREP
jgi:hypothetical protein